MFKTQIHPQHSLPKTATLAMPAANLLCHARRDHYQMQHCRSFGLLDCGTAVSPAVAQSFSTGVVTLLSNAAAQPVPQPAYWIVYGFATRGYSPPLNSEVRKNGSADHEFEAGVV